jgi:hypothetical protein
MACYADPGSGDGKQLDIAKPEPVMAAKTKIKPAQYKHDGADDQPLEGGGIGRRLMPIGHFGISFMASSTKGAQIHIRTSGKPVATNTGAAWQRDGSACRRCRKHCYV